MNQAAAHFSVDRYVRETYWAAHNSATSIAKLFGSANRGFGRYVARDLLSYVLGTAQPITGQRQERIKAAVEWILRAQDACDGGGVSLGYFPCAAVGGWQPAYPETTGYIIPTLLEYANRYHDDFVRKRALQMALWEIEIQMPSGAVQGGPVCMRDNQTPCAFNTGTVLQGWTAAFRETRDVSFLQAGLRAAEFLIKDIDDNGFFQTNGEFVNPSSVKTYNCLCAWALYRFGQDFGESKYCEGAIKVVNAALRQQRSNGWFENNCLTRAEAPLSHTIGYTLQGILEVGLSADREDFVAAVKKGTDPIVQSLLPNGFLYGRFYPDWEPAVFWSCLTGSAQIAVLCYRLFESAAERQYRAAADLILNFLKTLQSLDSSVESLNGAIGGSFPLLGGYMMLGYPNWATKYFVDALMLQDRLGYS
jgi:hypothetical protein